jgi:hypothetical protein
MKTKNDLKFVGRSSYNSGYPNWGPYKPESFSPRKLPYRGGDVKFHTKSTYNDTHISVGTSSGVKTYRPVQNMSLGLEFYGETTN